MIAMDDSGDCFSYLTAAGLDLSEIDSKSYRVINRIFYYMKNHNITTLDNLFPDLIKFTLKCNTPLILVEDFYT